VLRARVEAELRGRGRNCAVPHRAVARPAAAVTEIRAVADVAAVARVARRAVVVRTAARENHREAEPREQAAAPQGAHPSRANQPPPGGLAAVFAPLSPLSDTGIPCHAA